MEKIQMTTPLVEMDGDEMTRILWGMIKEKLILPFVDLKTEYYDLGLLSRNATKDQITVDAAQATKRLGVAVKCATITPNRQRMEEYPELTEMWKSPNGTIRAVLDGTAFRAPIVLPCIRPVVKNWEAPITIARHAYGDMYKAVDMTTEEPGTATLTFRGESGTEKTLNVQTVDGPAVWQGQHNKETSIRAFARSCFQYALAQKQDLWFSTKDTIAKVYDGEFKRIFEQDCQKAEQAMDAQRAQLDAILKSGSPTSPWIDYFRQFGRVEELTRPIAVKLIDQVLVYEGGRVEIVFRYQAEYEMARQFLSIHTQGSEWREAV